MIPLGLGMLAVAGLMWGAGAFSRASVGGVKTLLAWVAGLAGLSLVALLLLTGRGGLAIPVMVLAGPAAWGWWKGRQGAGRTGGSAQGGGARGGGAQGGGAQGGRARGDGRRMSPAEALSVLGLEAGASDSDVQAAWVRLMRVVHPDGGGTDDLAARVNQARDVLLRRR